LSTAHVIDNMFLMEKAAQNKAEKLKQLGQLSGEALEKLHMPIPVTKSLDSRITAKAQKVSKNNFPRGKMDLKKYMNASDPRTLASRAPIDTKRIMKHQGHENAKVINELRYQGGSKDSVVVNHEGDLSAGTSRLRIYDDGISAYGISLPSKDSNSARMIKVPFEKNIAKEERALTARHEISGESAAQSRTLANVQNHGYKVNGKTMGLFEIGSHQNPEVLNGDSKMLQRLSPKTKRFESWLRNKPDTGKRSKVLDEDKDLSQSQLMSLMHKGIPSGTMDDMQDVKNISYFDRKPMNNDELKESFKRIGNINTEGHQKQVVDTLAEGYFNTPLYTKRK